MQIFPAWFWPQLNETLVNATAGQDSFNSDFQNIITKNWTEAFSRVKDEDPTVTFTEAEYLPETSEVSFSALVVILQSCDG